MVSAARILVVDDEEPIRQLVTTVLGYEGFDAVGVADGRAALAHLERHRPDLLVLDVMMPGIDGFELHRRLDGRGVRIPLLYLTALDRTEDKVRGLTLGGDDYLTKPFSLDELVARVRSILRRTGSTGVAGGRLEVGDLRLDEELLEVTRAGEVISLTPTELKLLRFLMHHPRRVVSKAQILDHVWEYDFDGDANIVETYVSYLRRKIDHGRAPMIHTVRGAGYVLRPAEVAG
jgi:two-component system OmpR family response regulator